MKDPLKACTCEQCSLKKAKMSTSVKKFFKRYNYKKLRRMDLENPEYINFYYSQKKMAGSYNWLVYWAHNPETVVRIYSPQLNQDVAQPGRVLALGARCCRFKSCHPNNN